MVERPDEEQPTDSGPRVSTTRFVEHPTFTSPSHHQQSLFILILHQHRSGTHRGR